MKKKINYISVLLVLLGYCLIVEARAFNLKSVVKPAGSSAISRVVQSYVDKNSKGVGKIKIVRSDVQRDWALVWAKPVQTQVDTAQYLLHKEKGRWKVLVMGTSLNNTGEEYKVPNNLRKKWNL